MTDHIVSPVLYVVMIVLVMKVMDGLPQHRFSRREPPWVAIGLWLIVAIPSLLQFAFPVIYDVLHRDSDQIIDHGQWWRVYTSFMVQDGGVGGTAFNLFILALFGFAAERVWGTRMLLAFVPALMLVFSVDTFLVHGPPGGGNSGLTFRLATSIVGLALLTRPCRRHYLMAAAIVVDGAVLLLLGDGHGEPMITGMVAGLIAALVQRRRPRVWRPVADDPAAARPRSTERGRSPEAEDGLESG
ncbi:rhomboid family intramembrane serine protease [Streptomyces sp. NBC_00083]|uniref:rhomboid family intramembrane serine protease n=1 Tax=Streptomyces sp. NBC_00083 TaxID=2975647 RepID=UPI00224D1CF3|nr:rhomboid family intramembrane serine protease [Streptomyces sp. NBC_00083]MCX5386963.1 rhomboid family intramembrane serine protease [Streptomyces sp. NBC_00083]